MSETIFFSCETRETRLVVLAGAEKGVNAFGEVDKTHLPVCRRERDSREHPARARVPLRCEPNVPVRPHYGVAAKVEPPTLHVRVEVRLHNLTFIESVTSS